jgi:purine-cytosine permease-like protein
VTVSTSVRPATIAMFVAAGWMAVTWIAAASGVLREFERTPPPFAVLIVGILVLACVLAFGSVGTRLAAQLPLWVLVGVQGFRLPLELAKTMASKG